MEQKIKQKFWNLKLPLGTAFFILGIEFGINPEFNPILAENPYRGNQQKPNFIVPRFIRNPEVFVTNRREGVLTSRSSTSQINLREEPTTQSRSKGYGLQGDRVEILQENRPGDGYTWYQVKFYESGVIGWIRGDFIRVVGTPTNPATPPAVNLTQTGQGTFNITGSLNRKITQATVTINDQKNVKLIFTFNDQNRLELTGKIIVKDPYAWVIELSKSGSGNLKGVADIEYGRDRSISMIFADGTLQGKRFSIKFTKTP